MRRYNTANFCADLHALRVAHLLQVPMLQLVESDTNRLLLMLL
jgi:hypothetical protein